MLRKGLRQPVANPSRIDPAAELDALADAIIDGAADDENADFREIVDLATKELLRRFKDEPENLPGTFVIKLVLDGLKAIAARDVPEPDTTGDLSILDALDSVPRDHAVMVLDREILRLQDELARFVEKRGTYDD